MMDELKEQLAEFVASEMKKLVRLSDAEVTVTHPTKLQSQIRVKTRNQGTRYFTVQLKENY